MKNKILIVEDNSNFAILLFNYLTQYNEWIDIVRNCK